MSASPKVVIRNKRRVFDGFFKVDEVTLAYQQFDGQMSRERAYLVFERGDAAAVLIYNSQTDEVILTEQFRAPTLDKSQAAGWITEVMAGMIRTGEAPEDAAAREAREEVGYAIAGPEHIATFFSSPGGTSERIFLYYAKVTEADRVSDGGGVKAEGEDIRVVRWKPDELFERLRTQRLDDPKLLIAAFHLRDRLKIAPGGNERLTPGTIRYGKVPGHKPVIGMKTGPVNAVKGVDVWVNSENTDMMMDRIIGRTVSANVRYLGAEKNDSNEIVEDTIEMELRRRMGRRRHVKIATVIETRPGMLRERGVTRVLHVASVEGKEPGMGMRANLEDVQRCVRNALNYIHRRNNGFKVLSRVDTSILIPMIGCGDGGLRVEDVAPKIIGTITDFLRDNPGAALNQFYLLAFSARDRQACASAIEGLGNYEKLLDPPG